ncbi:MAG: bifunctional oligoribonuclease/PAP phosphatase NrnA [Flavobacteriales bacterium]|nr:bifunctional oligoribonuclease/PAP phosphatase NrnA [Flavobacteriales bacterium]
MTKSDFSEVKVLLSQPKKIVIIPHKNPDGDAMGSSLGLFKYLKNNGHSPVVLAPTDYPNFLKWLPNNDTVEVFSTKDQDKIDLIANAEVLFFMDFNTLDRVEEIKPFVDKSDAIKIMIDHHQQPDDFPDFLYSDPTICATSQMVYHLFENLGVVDQIDSDIATCLYTGILTDTGSFRFSSTTSTTHRIAADLIDKGAVNYKIHNNIFDGNSMARMKLMGVALSNLVIIEDCKSAYITMTRKELRKNNFKKGDTEGFVNMALSIENVNVAAIFIEDLEGDFVKVSLRSVGSFSVNQLSRDHFNGGGHINAAGGRVDAPIAEVVEIFRKSVGLNKDEIISSND